MDRDFASGFPVAGDSFTPLFLPAASVDDSLYSSPFSDPTFLSLLPDYSIDLYASPFTAAHYSDSPLFPQIPKLEPVPELSPSFPHRFDFFAGNLPALRSFESPSSFDSFFTNLVSTNQQTLESVVQDFKVRKPKSDSPPPKRGSKRKRSLRISDKYRSLQKLMPWEKKMDTASMLEEAFKYVRFLQAQVKALETMPAESVIRSENGALGSVFGPIGKLSRQQLLQVVLNTPEAQTMLYSQGQCVFSIEQLVRVLTANQLLN